MMAAALKLSWAPLPKAPNALGCRHNGYTAYVMPCGSGATLTIEPAGPVLEASSVTKAQQKAEEILLRTSLPEVRLRVPICLIRPQLRDRDNIDVDAVRSLLLAGVWIPGCELVPGPLPSC